MTRWGRMLAVLAVGLGLAACQMPMEIPNVPKRGAISPPAGKETAPFAFSHATSKIPRGTTIAAFPDVGAPFTLTCVVGRGISMEWNDRLSEAWNGEKGEDFYDAMKKAGYNVLGDPAGLFDYGKDISRAEYQVGARLVDVRGNFCNEITFWWGIETPRIKGEVYVKVEWEVYSVAESRVVGKFVTEGYGQQKEPAKQGLEFAMNLAFSDAAANLAGDFGFYNVIAPKDTAVVEAKPRRGASAPQEAMTLRGPRLSTLAVKDHLEEILDAVVTLRLPGDSHGSGFFISYDGYGLTNEHVVEKAKTVIVRLRSGVEVEAEVLQRDKPRDVALFKAPVRVLHPLPVAPAAKVSPLDETYAVGTPIRLGLEYTITRGMVSGHRMANHYGRLVPFIQASTEVSHGNSGGPLIDSKGNVVGMTDLGISDGAQKSAVNLFIPIGSALETLKIEVEPAKGR